MKHVKIIVDWDKRSFEMEINKYLRELHDKNETLDKILYHFEILDETDLKFEMLYLAIIEYDAQPYVYKEM